MSGCMNECALRWSLPWMMSLSEGSVSAVVETEKESGPTLFCSDQWLAGE